MTWEHKGKVAISGVGFSPIAQRTNTPLGMLATQAARAAVDDCGLKLSDIDGLATYPQAPFINAVNRDGEDIVSVEHFLGEPELGPIKWYSQAGNGLVMTSIRDAANALIAGACNYVLVWRAMYVPTGQYGRTGAPKALGDAQFTAPYGGVSPIQWHALAYRHYLETHGGDRQKMAALTLNSRRNANLNEHAIFSERTLSMEEYRNARMIADPLCLFDCDVPVTACVAVVMTTADRARDLRRTPAWLASIGQQTVNQPHLIYYALNDHIRCGKPLSDQIFADAGLGPKDISAAQLYDGFAPSSLYWLEAAGYCGRGEALDFIQDGRIALEGELPVNTFGGSLSQGRLHGMGHIAESVLQLSGRAGKRQLKEPEAIAVYDGSPMLRGGAMIVTRNP